MKKSLEKKYKKLDVDVAQIVMAKKIVNVAQIALVVIQKFNKQTQKLKLK
jgi:hypothetical protein